MRNRYDSFYCTIDGVLHNSVLEQNAALLLGPRMRERKRLLYRRRYHVVVGR